MNSKNTINNPFNSRYKNSNYHIDIHDSKTYRTNLNTNIYHKHDLICLQRCSNWILTLSQIIQRNKKRISKNFYGNIEEKNICYLKKYYPNELLDYFPIDIKENQRFILDKNNKKIPLLITFDFKKKQNSLNNEFISNIDEKFLLILLEIELNAFLHNDQKIFEQDINFRIKGFDIYKSIEMKLKELNKDFVYNIKEEIISLETFVFNNIQSSLGIGFIISKNNLINFINCKDNNSFFNFNICIDKLFFKYYLSLSVFKDCYLKKQNISNFITDYSFYNFKIFLSNTTILYENNDIKLKNIFSTIYKYSHLGVKCLFKNYFYNYVKINYFPFLSNVYLNINKNHSIEDIKKELSIDNQNYYKHYSSSKSNIENNIQAQKIYFKENFKDSFENINYIDQINKLITNNPELDIISLNNIGNDSYFSLIWVPFLNKKDKDLNYQQLPLISFEVFYNFKSDLKEINILNVIGIKEKDLDGKDIDASKIFSNFDYFWFSNLNIPLYNNNINQLQLNQLTINQNIFINKSFYLELKKNMIAFLNEINS